MKKFILITFIGILLTFILTYPLGVHLATNYPKNSDFYLNAFTYWYSSQSFSNGTMFDLNKFFNSTQLFPFPSILATQDYFVLPSLLLYFPTYSITNNHIFSVNLTIYISFVLNFISSFYFINKATKHRLASIIGATIYTFSPIVIQFGYSYVEYLNRYLIPPFIFLFFKFVKSPSLKNGFFLSLIYFLNWFCSIQISIFLFIISIFMFFGFIIIKLTRREATSLNLYKILKSSLIGLVFLPAILYFFYPYINFSHKEDFSRPLDEVQYYSARPLDFFLTSPDNITFGKLSKSLENIHYSGKEPPYSYGEHVLFPGLIASILLLLIVLNKHSRQILKKNLEVKVSFIAYLLSVIFAFGPYLKIGSVVIKLPYFYLYQYFPLLEAIRTPTRIIYVSLFFVSLLCAFEIMILKDFWRTRKNYLLLGVLALIIVEYLTYFPFQTINYVPLKFDLGGKNVLFLPIRKDIRSNNINGTKYLIQHLNNDFVSINGHTGSEPSIEGYDYLIDTLKNTEFSDRWFNVLRTLNVTYVVIDKRFLNDVRFLDQPISTNLQKFEKYTVYSDQTWSVIDITNINETNIASCKDSEPSRLQYVFDAKYSKGDNALTIYYDIKNNQNCHSSFIYDNRYFRINYTLNSKFNKHMYIKLPPYLLSGDTYGGSIQIPGKFKFKPELIAIDLGFSTMVLTIEDQPM